MGIRARAAKLYYTLSSSYWFVPAIMTLLSIVLAFVLVAVDQVYIPNWRPPLSWLVGGSPESSRSILSTIAGSMISVAATSYSVTFVVLTLASSQFGPRLLQLFMRDRSNQFVLGTFVAAFSYCLVLIKMVGNVGNTDVVPELAMLGAFSWALLSLGVLIFFFHSVAEMIQAPKVIDNVGKDLRRLSRNRSNKDIKEAEKIKDHDVEATLRAAKTRKQVSATSGGYVQVIDSQSLIQIAESQEISIQLLKRVGDWILEGSALAELYFAEEPSDEVAAQLEKKVNNSLILGNQRTPIDDLEFALLQLVEIAVRALSPGINDPFTAMNCIDELGSALALLVEERQLSRSILSQDGHYLVIIEQANFEDFVNTAFNQIRQHGQGDLSVLLRLLTMIQELIQHCKTPEQRAVLQRHLEMVGRAAQAAAPEQFDRQIVDRIWTDGA